ncbi:MAG TPA: DsbA family protein [Ilumatobacteraceae bacterium]|jgi:predicted DsbA family dithiol-disulfide isomerase|nr:DsbA family protein [Ilumatobacteraceae bacterium]
MAAQVEVFADITCPFTHVGLKQVVRHVAEMAVPCDVIVRAWPLEWVNGRPLDVDAVVVKAAALTEQLGVDDFGGLRADRWPTSTIPALELAAAAYARDAATGLAVSMELRSALFEHGVDVADADALRLIASAHHLDVADAGDAVRRDYELGQERGVRGSPHFFVDDDGFFCPALDLGHDADGHLTARFDAAMLADFFQRVDR